MVFETLFALDSKLAPQPMMLESSERSADGMRWAFTLRPSLRFHNGEPVAARDVVASLERWMGSTAVGGQLIDPAWAVSERRP